MAAKQRQIAERRLARVIREIDEAAAYFEDRGFDTQVDLLDGAAESVEAVAASLESL